MEKSIAACFVKHPHYKSIHEAVKVGDIKAVEQMVKDGASLNEVDDTKDRFTPMHWACNSGALECLHWLIWHGADTSVSNPKGWTPAHIAAIRGQDACIQALTNNGVNMFAKDLRGSTPAHMAASHGNTFTLHSLLRAGVEANAMDKNSWTPVHSAAFHGRLGCLQLLIRWGGSIDETDNLGNTPAHLSAMEGHLPCLKFIVGEGHNSVHILGARNNNGDTPKMLAQQFYKNHIVEYISNLEWEREHPEEAQNLAFPAHVAAYTGDLNHLQMLIENQIVNINERDDRGSTPAHKAAGQGHLETLQWLIEMGADMSIENQAGETPKDVARRFARLAALRMLGAGDEELDDDSADNPEKKNKTSRKSTRKQDSGDELDEDDEEDEKDEINVRLTKQEEKESRGRAKKKMEELERLFEIATRNYIQLGGVVEGDRKRLKEEKELKSQIADLETQLEFERNRREKLEVSLDQYKAEVARLSAELDQLTHEAAQSDRSTHRKKSGQKRTPSKEDGVFVRRRGNFKIL